MFKNYSIYLKKKNAHNSIHTKKNNITVFSVQVGASNISHKIENAR